MAGTMRLPEQRRGALAIANLPEEILMEILLLLPPRSILRCRAVCKSWRRVASDHDFLLAHHRRQPPRRLLSFVRDVGTNYELGIMDYCVEAIDLRIHEFQSIVRFTGKYCDCLEDDDDGPFAVHAACDGLLLMSYSNCLYLCNPATRQWVSVFPPALQHDTVAGLYAHGPPAEYRVLYYRNIGLGPTFYTSTVGSGEERCIWPHSSSTSVRKLLARGSEATNFKEPFLFHGNLHWLPHLPCCSNILVFDTFHEVFWLLHAPVTVCAIVSSLIEIEGKLAMSNSDIGESRVDLWILQDYKRMVWVHKYRIELPVMEISRFEEEEECWYSHILSGEGDVLVDGFDWLLHYDMKGSLLEKFQCDGRLADFTAKILRESLVPHAFFRLQENGSTHEPPFFRGLYRVSNSYFCVSMRWMWEFQ